MLDNLTFTNGVALSHDGEYLLLAETGPYRISKVWLAGPRAGQRETLLDNLPGLPDNITTGTDGVFWVALPSHRSRVLDSLLPKPGRIRTVVWALPDALQPAASRCTFVLGIDGQGNVVHNLQADGKRFHYVTGVREGAGHLWLGSLAEKSFARVPWPATVNG